MKSEEITNSIGKKIQSARLIKNLTQEQLAEKCNSSTNHISAIENGHSNCSFSLMISICNNLDITPNYLFEDFIKSKNDSINYINNDILTTYLKLKPKSKEFIDDAIVKVYSIQKMR